MAAMEEDDLNIIAPPGMYACMLRVVCMRTDQRVVGIFAGEKSGRGGMRACDGCLFRAGPGRMGFSIQMRGAQVGRQLSDEVRMGSPETYIPQPALYTLHPNPLLHGCGVAGVTLKLDPSISRTRSIDRTASGGSGMDVCVCMCV
jgi:hypothetical protein